MTSTGGPRPPVRVVEEPWDHPDGQRLRALQRLELEARFGRDAEPGAKPTAASVAVFVVARDAGSGEALGCGGLRPLAPGVAELKRMYVVAAARGRGVGRAVLVALEEAALARGWTTLRLETGHRERMPEAVGLYTGAGYVPIPPFGDYVGEPDSQCFERRLG